MKKNIFYTKYKVNLIRLGNNYDGGYLIPQSIIKKTKLLLSFGLGTDWSFEKNFKNINKNLKINCYDHTINRKFWYEYTIVAIFFFIKNFKNFNNIFTFFKYRKFFSQINVRHIQKKIVLKKFNSIDISWADDLGAANTDNITGINISFGSTYSFTHSSQLNVLAGESYDITVQITLPNDSDLSDNSLSMSIAGLTFNPNKITVGEEKTGEWCGWCPRGAVAMAEMATYQGVDLYSFKSKTGTDIHDAISFLLDSIENTDLINKYAKRNINPWRSGNGVTDPLDYTFQVGKDKVFKWQRGVNKSSFLSWYEIYKYRFPDHANLKKLYTISDETKNRLGISIVLPYEPPTPLYNDYSGMSPSCLYYGQNPPSMN